MRLTPHLNLGPRRLLRRPVEALLLILAITVSSFTLMVSLPLLFNTFYMWENFSDSSYLRQLEVSWQAHQNTTHALYPDDIAKTFGVEHPGFSLDQTKRLAALLPPCRGFYLQVWQNFRAIEGQFLPAGNQVVKLVSPGWLPSLDGTMVEGRFFSEEDLFASDRHLLVIGERLAKKYFGSGQAVGKTLVTDTNSAGRVTWTIIGVSRIGDSNMDWLKQQLDSGLLVNHIVESNPYPEMFFVAERADQVLGGTEILRRDLERQYPDGAPVVMNNYAILIQQFQATIPVAVIVIVLSLTIQLIALWTMVSLYLARLPGLAWSLRVVQALGASRRQIIGLIISEILPVVLIGLLGGFGMAATAPRVLGLTLDTGSCVKGISLAWLLVLALVSLMMSIPIRQALARLSGERAVPHAPRPPRWSWTTALGNFLPRSSLAGTLLAMLFLAGAIACLLVTFSASRQIMEQLSEAQARLPLWIADGRLDNQGVQSERDDVNFIVLNYPPVFDRAAARALVQKLGPARVSRFDDPNAHLEIAGHAWWPRYFFLADPSVAGIIGLDILKGQLPGPAELAKADQVLLSDEVVQLLGPAGNNLLGSTIELVANGNFRMKSPAVVSGIYRRPAMFQLGYQPDVLLFTGTATEAAADAAQGADRFALQLIHSRFMVDPREQSAQSLQSDIVPALKALYPSHPELNISVWRGGAFSDSDQSQLRDLQANNLGMLSGTILLGLILLIVACVNVLALTFNTVIRRSHDLALQRALGRSFNSVVAGSFIHGFLLALGAGIGAFALTPLASRGIIGLMTQGSGTNILLPSLPIGLPVSPEVALVAIPLVAVLVGLVAMLPLFGLRKASIAGMIKEEG